MSEHSIGEGSQRDDRTWAQRLSHAPGSPRRQVQFGHVCCLQLGGAVSVHLHVGAADWTLSIVQPFMLCTRDGLLTMDPGGQRAVDRAALAPLLPLIAEQAYAPEWDRTGHVGIEFEDGSLLACGPDSTETAWRIIGPHGQTWSCRPGGQVVRNQDRPITGAWQRF